MLYLLNRRKSNDGKQVFDELCLNSQTAWANQGGDWEIFLSNNSPSRLTFIF